MHRTAIETLIHWKDKANRKPLVIRGARQVGKSYLVRDFAKRTGLDLLEINFELNRESAQSFLSKHPQQVVSILELTHSRKIIPGETLLFLDEIQAAPEVFATLRYFYELMPELHVIAAGSLLEFVLEDHLFSMPVGRIEYLHLGPMTFKEFLRGLDKEELAAFIEAHHLAEEMPPPVHRELLRLFKLYLAIGGMPEAIHIYHENKSLLEVDSVKQSILLTYRDDFSKYGQRVDRIRLQKIFQKLPLLVGRKLKYVHLDKDDKSSDLKKSLHLLELARIYYPVYHCSANGIPLRAERNEKFQKPLFLDVGLLMSACGMNYANIETMDDITLVNSGPVCEQFIGQHLLYRNPDFQEPELFYWCREKYQASAEIDYLIHSGTTLIPVEVKAGKTGALKSLQVFIREKGLNLGVRFNTEPPSMHPVPFVLPDAKGEFRLLSLPLYMVEELNRLIA
jgi:hypothetical protein